MRATGVQAVTDAGPQAAEQSARRSPAKVALIALLTLLGAVGGYFVWGRRPSAGDPGMIAPVPAEALPALLSAANVDPRELTRLLTPDAAVSRFAKQAAGSASEPYAKADAVTRAIRARASALSFVPWSLAEPRATAMMSAPQTLAQLGQDNARAQLYPLELAALAVAALRALEVPAMVAELIEVEGERAPLDPSGYLGYFAVAVYPGEAGLGTPRVFDPYGGRALSGGYKHAVLRDLQAIGAAIALRALHEVGYLADPRRALGSSSDALALAGALPSVRTVRGMVVLAGKQVEQGLQEFAAARQLRPDPPRLHNVATTELMTGDVERASKDLHAALERAPDFASAHATLGSLALLRGEPEQARQHLDKAQKLAPDLTLVDWALAELWLRTGEREQAIRIATRALASRPSFDARLRMGVLLRQAGRYDELRKQAQALLAMAPSYRASEVRELIRAALGPAALDEAAPLEEAEEADGAAPLLPDLPEPKLELGQPQSGAAGGPALRDPSAPADGPKLRLRDDREQLRLSR